MKNALVVRAFANAESAPWSALRTGLDPEKSGQILFRGYADLVLVELNYEHNRCRRVVTTACIFDWGVPGHATVLHRLTRLVMVKAMRLWRQCQYQ